MRGIAEKCADILRLPLCAVFCFTAALCAIADFYAYRQHSSLYLSAALASIFAAGTVTLFIQNRRLFAGLLMLIFFSTVLFVARHYTARPVYLEGEVLEVRKTRYSQRVVFYAAPLKAKTLCYTAYPVLKKGQVSYNSAERIQPDSPYSLSLLREGIEYSAYCTSAHGGSEGHLSKLRSIFSQRIRDIFTDTQCAAFLNAVLLSDKNDISKSEMLRYRRAGLLHVLAASGMHVGIIAGGVFLLFGFAVRQRTPLHLIASVILLFYLIITGIPVSLARACIMFWVVALTRVAGIRTGGVNSLFMAGFLILSISPAQLFNAGFQLSFLATAGILVLYKPLKERIPPLPLKIDELCAITLAAQIPIVPLLFAIFRETNGAGLLSGILCLPVVSLFINASLLLLFISLLTISGARFLAGFCTILYSLYDMLSSSIASMPLHVRSESLLPMTLFFVTIALLFVIRTRVLRTAVLLLSPLIFALYTHMCVLPHESHPSVNFEGRVMKITGALLQSDIDAIERIVINRNPSRVEVLADRDFFSRQKEYLSLMKRISVNEIFVRKSQYKWLSRRMKDIIENENIEISPHHSGSFAREPARNNSYGFNRSYLKKLYEFIKSGFKKSPSGLVIKDS